MPSRNQLTRQAALLARIRYGPETGALSSLLSDARSTRDLSIQNARGGADSLVATLQGIRPQLSQIYAQGAQQRHQAGAEADQAMAGISGVIADSIRAARAREAAQADVRASESQIASQKEVGQRTVDARIGAIRGAQQAERAYRQDTGKIGQRLTGLMGEQGAFIETSLADLTEQQRKRAIADANMSLDRERVKLESERVTNEGKRLGLSQDTLSETERHNRAMERNAARNRRNAASGGASATPETRRGAHRDIRKAFAYARSENVQHGEGKKFIDAFLVGQKGMDPLLAKAGTSYYLYGQIDPSVRQDLMNEYGVGGVKQLRRRR